VVRSINISPAGKPPFIVEPDDVSHAIVTADSVQIFSARKGLLGKIANIPDRAGLLWLAALEMADVEFWAVHNEAQVLAEYVYINPAHIAYIDALHRTEKDPDDEDQILCRLNIGFTHNLCIPVTGVSAESAARLYTLLQRQQPDMAAFGPVMLHEAFNYVCFVPAKARYMTTAENRVDILFYHLSSRADLQFIPAESERLNIFKDAAKIADAEEKKRLHSLAAQAFISRMAKTAPALQKIRGTVEPLYIDPQSIAKITVLPYKEATGARVILRLTPSELAPSHNSYVPPALFVRFASCQAQDAFLATQPMEKIKYQENSAPKFEP